MRYSIRLTRSFSAAHAIVLEDGSLEPVHGHDWGVVLTAARADGGLDGIGCVADFHVVEKALDAVISGWHSRHLNEVMPFVGGVSPTAEHVAREIATAVRMPAGVVLVRVEVEESPGCVAVVEV